MAVPQATRNQVALILVKWSKIGFFPNDSDMNLLRDVAREEPPLVLSVVQLLVPNLNAGAVDVAYEAACIGLLADFAEVSEYLSSIINGSVDHDLVDHYCNAQEQSSRKSYATRLATALKIGRPKHYFDLARNMLTAGGSIVVVGAGFSYDSYAPLMADMEGIACATLDDLGVENPRELYRTDEGEAWRIIGEGWKTFQRHMSYLLLPKEPALQHFILSELFHPNVVTHIVSLNWDDLLEKAYLTTYGTEIPTSSEEGSDSDHALWKIHGDVRDPSQRWVLPYEEGRVFKAVRRVVAGSHLPCTVLGYREQEAAVRDQLILPLQNRGGVTRIRPDLTPAPPDYLADTASVAMQRIRAGLDWARSATTD